MTAPDMLSAALELAASVCPVFPCNPANKRVVSNLPVVTRKWLPPGGTSGLTQ
jgi:hypothetical protein